ncbi:hypothetical protein E0L17_04255 [Olsenella sp. SW781]|uniref:hypothetical protein n=1 Tax=Olsenella sp. SW781 TaxID=2530046 RepID=UPI00143A6CCE|nr:hypothetical protein [Olsenella sp. SW781]NJE80537.1 hypothetical protein [Olsenella sp. SW781]
MTNLTRRNLIFSFFGVAGILGLAACGDNPTTGDDTEPDMQEISQEDMLAQAEDFNGDSFYEMRNENEAKTKQQYDGKIFCASGYVEEITTDYIILSEFGYGVYYNPIIVELPEDVIAVLMKEQEITACGTFEYAESPNISRLVDAFIVE